MSDEERSEGEMQSASAKEVTLADIEPGQEDSGASQNLDFLLDIPLEISVELGKTKISIGDLLKLSQGAVVELNKSTEQPFFRKYSSASSDNFTLSSWPVPIISRSAPLSKMCLASSRDTVCEVLSTN